MLASISTTKATILQSPAEIWLRQATSLFHNLIDLIIFPNPMKHGKHVIFNSLYSSEVAGLSKQGYSFSAMNGLKGKIQQLPSFVVDIKFVVLVCLASGFTNVSSMVAIS